MIAWGIGPFDFSWEHHEVYNVVHVFLAIRVIHVSIRVVDGYGVELGPPIGHCYRCYPIFLILAMIPSSFESLKSKQINKSYEKPSHRLDEMGEKVDFLSNL